MRLAGLTPMLETEDLKKTVKFYTDILGFECTGLYPEKNEPFWACVRKDDVEIMFTARNEHSTVEKPTMTGSLYFHPDQVDEAWEQLRGKATIEYPIENFDYGMREFAIQDCNGYLLQFGQEVPENV
jgi:uncharacterized glyoxalase superfamily protein PhnB